MAGYKSGGDWIDVTSTGRNEIVFEGRLKEYGAYFVRSRYRKTLIIAFGIAVFIGAFAVSLPVIIKVLGKGKSSNEIIKHVTVHLSAPPPPAKNLPPPPPPPPPPKQLIKQLRVPPTVVAKHVIDTIPPPTVHQEQQTNIGLTTQKGKDTIIAPINTDNQVIGDQNSNKIFTIVKQMPKFNGNLQQYLSDHIQYPEMEKEAGITGTVYVTFVVEKDGSITNVKVLRGVSGGADLDAEAVRVIKAMPKWSVGMQNGHPVRVQFNLPIRFELR